MNWRAILLGLSIWTLVACGAEARFPRGGAPSIVVGKSVLNDGITDYWNNVLKQSTCIYDPVVTPPTGASGGINADGYPVGSLPAQINCIESGSNPPVSTTYYGRYRMKWTGVGAYGPSAPVSNVIIYSGGAAVFGITPAATGWNFGLSGYNNANQTTGGDIVFSFGVMLTGVTTSGGLVRFQTTTNGAFNFPTGLTVKCNTPGLGVGPNGDGSWTITQINTQTFDLQASGAYAGLVSVTGAGGAGVQSECLTNTPQGLEFKFPASASADSVPSYSMSNLMLGKEADINDLVATGRQIRSDVITFYNAYKPGWLRWMNGMAAQSFYANYSDIPASTAFSWASQRWYSGYWSGTATNSGDAYSIASSSTGPYVDGETFQFATPSSYGNAGVTPTLNVNSRGAAPILTQFYAPVYITTTGSPTTADTYTFNFSGLFTDSFVYTVNTSTPGPGGNPDTDAYQLGNNIATTINQRVALKANGFSCGFTGITTSPIIAGQASCAYPAALGALTVAVTPSGGATAIAAVGTMQSRSVAGTISGTTLTVTNTPTATTIVPGQTVRGVGITTNSIVQPYGTGGTSGTGGAGTYSLTQSSAAGTASAVFGGDLPRNSGVTLIYNKLLGGFTFGNPNGATFGLTTSLPLAAITEASSRTGAGAWLAPSSILSQAGYQSLGTYFATNMPGQKVAIEFSNEIWNFSAFPTGQAVNMGRALGFDHGSGASANRDYQDFYGLRVAQNLPAFYSGYTGAGGAGSNVVQLSMDTVLDGSGGYSAGTMVCCRWNGLDLTPTPASFSGTISAGTTLTVSGITAGVSGAIWPSLTLNGSCVTAGTKIVQWNSGTEYGNGVYTITPSNSSGSCSMTVTNPAYSAGSGPGGTASSTAYNAFPTRPIDFVDAVGFATYYRGGMAGRGAESWFGTQSFYNLLFQASLDYFNGSTAAAFNAWAADINTGTRNGTLGADTTCAFLKGYTDPTCATITNSEIRAYETAIAAYDGARPSGKSNLNVMEYEGSIEQTLAANAFAGTSSTTSPAELASQFNNNGWNLQATYGTGGCSGASACNLAVATNLVNLQLAFFSSTQFYNTELDFINGKKAIFAARSYAPAQFGVTGPQTVPGVYKIPLWGIFSGDLNSTFLQNGVAQQYFNNH